LKFFLLPEKKEPINMRELWKEAASGFCTPAEKCKTVLLIFTALALLSAAVVPLSIRKE